MLLPTMFFVGVLAYGVLTRAPAAEPGKPAPDFELELFAGLNGLPPPVVKDGMLSSKELYGRPVVANFWASWCVPCREEAPRLERAWREYKDRGVIFLGINVQDGRSDALEFIDEFDMSYPQVSAPGFELTNDFDVVGVPETFFIGHDWRFVGVVSGATEGEQGGLKILGAITEEDLAENVKSLMQYARRAESSSN